MLAPQLTKSKSRYQRCSLLSQSLPDPQQSPQVVPSGKVPTPLQFGHLPINCLMRCIRLIISMTPELLHPFCAYPRKF